MQYQYNNVYLHDDVTQIHTMDSSQEKKKQSTLPCRPVIRLDIGS